ncbi:related to tRNA dimethylallyltransferase, mitochondrial [Saccharomycodes ludwigii]|uniref:tRNA dimethylallyltransferase n=1 Tax=Saccharomycodes ludwigii TaxID=36035 RepID=A0A376BB17_9ASCO|nr:hypothetical protein SCDLUD_002211 [Saccharomycodes ludwigii]KAH3902390.1 hypothetical protein SCDLUD_002211 [Saccharomycodes ludwigii]SSD61868.1 related to tRNA dimethylallyltransferase, mitochondrial [Saccharomycodes ludwigii]
MTSIKLTDTITSPKRLIVIAGTTGVGKSQLSIELASKYNGEIINSDSMQMYQDIPIITNKHPINERNGIPHHIINHVPWNKEYDMHIFEKECLSKIYDILQRGKTPIIVGGTHYYLQVLFNNKKINNAIYFGHTNDTFTEDPNAEDDPKELYSKLLEIDPLIASKYHPNDTRRVKRMLEIYHQSNGIKPSEIFQKQQISLKFENTLFFWLYSDPTELNKRLDDRVDQMISNGAYSEIQQLYKYYCENNKPCLESGIWQVIGFKEFLPWLLSQDTTNADDNTILYKECVEKMKLRTRQYAKRQIKWIKKMLISDIRAADKLSNFYVLNATDLNKWDQLVKDRANLICDGFFFSKNGVDQCVEHVPKGLENIVLTEECATASATNTNNNAKFFDKFTCSTCKDKNDENLILIGKEVWGKHLKSRRHKSNLNRGKKKKEYEEWKLKNTT